MKLRPLMDRVVLRQVENEEVSKGGIILTNAAKEKPQMAEVVAAGPGAAKEKPEVAEVIEVGPGGLVDGKEVKMDVKAGDKVVYSKYAGTEVKLDGEEYVIVKQSDILAVVE